MEKGDTVDRISTGIKKIDAKLKGGFPKSKGFLITGAPGSGKTIFGLHFIFEACKNGKKCIFIATEETPEDILTQAEMLGFDLGPYIKSKQLSVIRILEIRARNVASSAKMLDDLAMDEIKLIDMVHLVPNDVEVVVIDNIGVFALDMSVKDFRNEFDTLNHILSKLGCTTLFVMDNTAYEQTDRIADYSTHGSIKLIVRENVYTGKMERYISIPKMRSTDISPDLMKFIITPKGLELISRKVR